MGTIDKSTVALRMASCISSSEIESGSSKNFSNKASSYSATASTKLALQVCASSSISSGISISSKVMPSVSMCQIMPFIFIKSTTPLKSSSAPIGNCNGTALEPNISFTCFTTIRKSAPARSILLTKPIRGTP